MSDLTKLSAAKLEALYTKAFDAYGEINKALINAGYGMERGSDTRARAASTGDALAVSYVKATDRFNEIVAEQGARKRYHGSLKPIKRAA